MVFRMPAPEFILCPKCQNGNAPGKTHVWQVADGTGPHYDCAVCAHTWNVKGPNDGH